MKRILLISFMLLSAVFNNVWAQDRTVSGNVTDDTGESIPGVNVILKGTATGATSDLDGNWKLSIPSDGGTLVFSFIGMETQEVEIGSRSVVDVKLTTDVQQLSEVVVTGYNFMKRSDLTSSIVEIEASKIQAQPIGSIDNLLQGHAAGVNVVSENGRPGGKAFIRIRGIGSINASTEPLFIIDGVQMTSSAYNAINPNDVKSITVLKDAASTSIYGARASNGVVLITTKSGADAKGGLEISYKYAYGQKEFIPTNFDMMNKEEKLRYEVEVGQRSQADADIIMNSAANPETDWLDVLFRKGIVKSHDLSFSGNTDKATYFASVGYYKEEGISKASSFERFTVRLNSTFELADWLKVGNQISVGQTDDNETRDRNNVQNPFSAAFSYNPYEPEFLLYDEDGADAANAADPEVGAVPGGYILDENGDPQYNLTHQGFSISEALRFNPENLKRTNIIGNFFAAATPIENLTLTTKVGMNYQVYDRYSYVMPGSVLDGYIGDKDAPGSKNDNKHNRTLTNWTNTAQYNFTLNSVHNFSAMIGTEYIKYDIKEMRVSGKGFASDKLFTQDNAAAITDGATSREEYALWSQFGQLNYNFSDKYVVSGSLRRDGSSRFGEDNKFGMFWAGSVAWNITEESFFSFDIIDQMKLRASIGTSGNTPDEFYAAPGLFRYSSYNKLSSATPDQLPNGELKWESTTSTSVGVDFGVLDNRVSGAFDYFQRKTSDLLFDRPVSETVGYRTRLENIGDMTNKGIELELNVDIIRSKDFSLSVFGSFSTVKNNVDDLKNEGADIINNDSGVTLLREGEGAHTYYLVRYAGVNPANGDPLYYTKDGEVTSTYSADDAVVLSGKSPLPTYFGGLGLSAGYKGIVLSANLSYQGGNYIYNSSYAGSLLSDGDNAGSAQRTDAFNYWKNPGDVNVLPRAFAGNSRQTSDRYLQKGDFVRLRNVMLAYSLPQNILSKAKLKELTVYVQGTNLWTMNRHFSGDPEIGTGSAESDLELSGEYNLWSYPASRGFTVGVNLTF